MAQAPDVNIKDPEADSNDVPYYKWPPWPNPPEGVNIIPFSKFKPSGIQISIDDTAEVDALGIPTVRLPVTHDNEAPPKKKKKTKKTPAGEEIQARSIWYEEWAEGEDQRIRSVRAYDQTLHAKARVAQAVEDFQRLHDWQPPASRLLEWYGKLLYFLGLNDVYLRPKFRKKRIEDDDKDFSDDANDEQRKENKEIKVENFDEGKHKLMEKTMSAVQEDRFRQKIARVKEAQELRLDAFVDNPYLATKIFFSSYFRDSGMMWEKMALKDCPHIVEFFLNFLLQTRAISEEKALLKHALEVASMAKHELPLTMDIGRSIPDELSLCLKSIFGSRVKELSWPDEPANNIADADFKVKVEQSGAVIASDLDSEPRPETAKHNSAAIPDARLPQAEGTTAGWSSIGVDVGGWGGNWGAEASTDGQNGTNGDDSWGQTDTSVDVWTKPDIHSLMVLLGPTTLPITHRVGYVEESTRCISSVKFPETNPPKLPEQNNGFTTSDLFRSFARVVLKPYKSFAAPSAPNAAIQPPELIEDPWSRISENGTPNPRIPRHDPERDSITMLVDPEVAKLLASGAPGAPGTSGTSEESEVGIGLGGTFVQVVSNYDTNPSDSPANDQVSDATASSAEVTFWYAEKILQIIPSFWTEKTI